MAGTQAAPRADARVDLDHALALPTEAALDWLMSLPGVGIKTASLVLLFCFSKPILPVDTHVHRISKRVELIGESVSANAAHRQLLDLLPKDPLLLFNLHKGLLAYGRQICTYHDPQCRRCPLADLCDWWTQQQTAM